MRRWYLVYTKPACEAIAETNLSRQGYDVYLPRLVESVRRGARLQERIVALFPRYLFLRLDEGRQPLGPVRSSIGVSGIVRFGANYALVPDAVVNNLRACADPISGLHRLSLSAPLQAGTGVHLVAGPLQGLEGVFMCQAGSDRVVVLLQLLGRGTLVRVPAWFVEPGHAA